MGVSKKAGKKVKKGIDLAAQIGSIIAESQGYNKEADAMQRVGKVVANRGGGKKTKKVKNTIGDLSQIAALLGQTSWLSSPRSRPHLRRVSVASSRDRARKTLLGTCFIPRRPHCRRARVGRARRLP